MAGSNRKSAQEMEKKPLQELEQVLQYHFRDSSLLQQALKHASSAEIRTLSSERLEFLGDAVLNLVICRHLYDRFPEYLEGDLTKIKSMLVARRTCAKVAKQMGLEAWMEVSKGISGTRGFEASIAAEAVEAVIAAIYLDGGYDEASKFVHRAFGSFMETVRAEQHHENYKSLLQQYAQQEFHTAPVYLLLDEKGPDHDKCFEVGVAIGQRHFPSAWGVSKKEAEQQAARNALLELRVLDDPADRRPAESASSAEQQRTDGLDAHCHDDHED
jgi:ribonuclease-3